MTKARIKQCMKCGHLITYRWRKLEHCPKCGFGRFRRFLTPKRLRRLAGNLRDLMDLARTIREIETEGVMQNAERELTGPIFEGEKQ